MNTLVLKEFENLFITSTNQFLNSYELTQNFKVLTTLKSTYDQELRYKLILAREMDLIEFFNGIEKKLLNMNYIFDSIQNKELRLHLQGQVQSLRVLNIDNIKKYLLISEI